LEFLPDQDGAALLHSLGVNRAGSGTIGPDDAELRAASREVNGHALSLRLLGLYLKGAHGGAVRRRDRVDLGRADALWKNNRLDQPYGHAFWDRIQRRGEAYSTNKLGLVGADLGAVASFFEAGWARPLSALSEGDRAWLLNEAAYRLRALGRLAEAVEPMRAAMEMCAEQKDWKNAATDASNISELEATLGRLSAALDNAERAVEYADRSGDPFMRIFTPP
jgi:tetratricopeptide (TPR) repeat protein